MKNWTSFSAFSGLAAGALLTMSLASASTTISNTQVANVTPSSASVVWNVAGDTSVASLDVYSDAGGLTSVRSQVRVELFPLEMNNRTVKSTEAERSARRSLQTLTQGRGLVHVRLSGLNPGSTYYVRARAKTAAGAANEAALPPLVPVTTAQENAFIIESRQLRVDFEECFPGSDGALVKLTMAGAPYPLITTIGDFGHSGQALFDLNRLLNNAGTTNRDITGSPTYTLQMLGNNAPAGDSVAGVSALSQYVVARVDDAAFLVGFPGLSHFTIDGAGTALTGQPYTVTIRARQSNGTALTTFNGAVDVSSTGSLLAGAGTTPVFNAGVLTHTVVAGTAGTWTLNVVRTCGAETGSHPFVANALTFSSWRNFFFAANGTNESISGFNADPDGDGTNNGGEYLMGRNPMLPDANNNISDRLDSGEFTFTFQRAKLHPGATIQPQWTENLSLWRTDTLTETILEDRGHAELIEATVPATGKNRMMGRVRFLNN